jgi:hypothetical protein
VNQPSLPSELESLLVRTKEAQHLVQAWFALAGRYLATGHAAIIPSASVRYRCERDLLAVLASNVYTLFDPLGTNCVEVLATRNNAGADTLLDSYIMPTWLRIRTRVIQVRSNLGHHAPYHVRGKLMAERVLDGLSPGELVCLTLGIRQAVLLACETPGVEEFGEGPKRPRLPIKHPELSVAADYESTAAQIDHWLDRIDSGISLPRSVVNALHWLADNTWRIPCRMMTSQVRKISIGIIMRRLRDAPADLPTDYLLVRDQFLATNSLFLVYYSHIHWHFGVIGSGWRTNAHTLLITWYSHVFTLFEESRVSLTSLMPTIAPILPKYSRWLYEKTIAPEWEARKGDFDRLRHDVGFHRARRHEDARDTHEAFMTKVPGDSTTFMMRMLYLFFWTVEAWQGRVLDTVTVPHWAPPDALDPTHRLSIDREYFAGKAKPTARSAS